MLIEFAKIEITKVPVMVRHRLIPKHYNSGATEAYCLMTTAMANMNDADLWAGLRFLISM